MVPNRSSVMNVTKPEAMPSASPYSTTSPPLILAMPPCMPKPTHRLPSPALKIAVTSCRGSWASCRSRQARKSTPSKRTSPASVPIQM